MSSHLARISSSAPVRATNPDLHRAHRRHQSALRQLDAAQIQAWGVGVRRWSDLSPDERRRRLQLRGRPGNPSPRASGTSGATRGLAYDFLAGVVINEVARLPSTADWDRLEAAADRTQAAERQLTIAQRQAAAQAAIDQDGVHLTKAYRDDLAACNGSQACRDEVDRRHRDNRFKNAPAANRPGQTGPTPDHGYWEGERGNSRWHPPTNSDAHRAMADYPGQRGINYSQGDPDLRPFTSRAPDGRLHQADITDMRGDHSSDYRSAHREMGRDFPGWTRDSVKGPPPLTPHHMRNGTTMAMVDSRIHGAATGGGAHLGGASVVRSPQF